MPSTETVFITGATGFLGGYVANELLTSHPHLRLAALVRAKDEQQAIEKLWRGLQLHMDGDRFWELLPRVEIVYGDLHSPGLGIAAEQRERLIAEVGSILHIAASLNRKSAKACLNTNLRGTLSVVQLAREIADGPGPGLRRYSHVSTVAVAGQRDREVVQEDSAIEWERSDYDPYARTKKFCEHMARELLGGDVPLTFFRPSIVMGDSRFAETSQFDMVRAFCTLADLPIVPLDPAARLDIVNADWVGHAVATLHMKPEPEHDIYHLSSGLASRSTGDIASVIAGVLGRKPRFVPRLVGPFGSLVHTVAGIQRRNIVTLIASLLKVFLPYITYDTVFDNARAVRESGQAPVPFTAYCADLYRYAKRVDFEFPYQPLPPRAASASTEAAA